MGKQNLLNIVLIGITEEIPQQNKEYELHRLLGTLLSDKIAVNNKLEIMEDEYHILVNDDLRKDVNIMCNLGEGIEERAIAKTTRKVTEEFIMSMYEKKFTLEQIADVAHKSVAEIEEIIKENHLISV